jgi:hypothetical protein
VAESKTITATAGGVVITDQATITVNKAGSTVEITSDDPDPSDVNEVVHVEFTVTGTGGTPTGDVTITLSGGSETCTGTLSGGSGACDITPLVPGTGTGNRRTFTATYGGDAQFSGDTDTENHRVDPLPNAPPVAGPDAFQTNEDEPLTVPAPGVLANDTDPEGGTLTVPDASDAQNGTVELTGGGGFTYTPNSDFSGTDQFTYTLRDAAGATATGTVTIQVNAVNDPPTAQNDAFQTTQGQTLTVVPPGLLANDSDPEGETLTVTDAGDPQSGMATLQLTGGGGFTYTPDPSFVGQDQFLYVVEDASGESSTATATIQVNAVSGLIAGSALPTSR